MKPRYCHYCRRPADYLLFGRWHSSCYKDAPSLNDLMAASEAWRANPVPFGWLRCNHCGGIKPYEAFSPSCFVPGGWCRECAAGGKRREDSVRAAQGVR